MTLVTESVEEVAVSSLVYYHRSILSFIMRVLKSPWQCKKDYDDTAHWK